SQRFPHWSGRNHLYVPIAPVSVPVIVAGKDMRNAIFMKQPKISLAYRMRNVEILIRFVRALKEIRMMLKHKQMPDFIAARLLQLIDQPLFLGGCLLGRVLRMCDEA